MSARRSKLHTVFAQLAVEDVFFKALVWFGVIKVLELEGEVAWLAVKAYIVPALASSALWLSAVWISLRPLARWRGGADDDAALREAGDAAWRAPARYPFIAAPAWGLALSGGYLPLELYAGASLPPGTGVGVLLLVLGVMIGAPTLASLHLTHALTPITGRISVEARRRGIELGSARASMRRRNALYALGLTLTPTVALTGLTHIEQTRSTQATVTRDARLRATELALELQSGRPFAPAPDRWLLDASGAPLGGGATVPPLVASAFARLGAGDAVASARAGGDVAAVARAGGQVVACQSRAGGASARSLMGRLTVYFIATVLFVLLGAWYQTSNMVTVVERVAAALREIAQAGGAMGQGRIPMIMRDELGVLVESANEMIDRLEQAQLASRDATESLRQANALLEHRVEERTAALRIANHDLAENNLRLKQARSQLTDVARKAGMAEVASSVLHNVGNVLNSVNVSTAMLAERIRNSKVAAVRRALELIPADEGAAQAFFTSDPRGRLAPVYLRRLAPALADESAEMVRELAFLEKHIEHIKVIIGLQQAHAKQGGLIERLRVAELVDDAVRFTLQTTAGDGPQVTRELDDSLELVSDRHRLFQILINLLRNARDAVAVADAPCVRVTTRASDDAVTIEVADNGCGVEEANLTRIFSLGFTTKPNGHGYGLHSSALAARELGGELAVHSDGPGRGTRFTLRVPRGGDANPVAAAS